MSRLDDFEAAHVVILGEPKTRTSAQMRRYMADWMGDVEETTGFSRPAIINNAISIAGLRRLALAHELQVVLRGSDDVVHELPLPSKRFTEQIGDVMVTFNMTQRTESWLHWMQGQGFSAETTLFDGMSILGRLALVSDGQLIIPDFGVQQSSRYWPGMSFEGAPPLIHPNPE